MTLLEKYPILALTEEQVKTLWRNIQNERERQGLPFYLTCVDPLTNEVWIRKDGDA